MPKSASVLVILYWLPSFALTNWQVSERDQNETTSNFLLSVAATMVNNPLLYLFA